MSAAHRLSHTPPTLSVQVIVSVLVTCSTLRISILLSPLPHALYHPLSPLYFSLPFPSLTLIPALKYSW